LHERSHQQIALSWHPVVVAFKDQWGKVSNVKGVPAAGLLVAVVVASLVPFLLVGAVLLFNYVTAEREAALHRLGTLADSISATVDRELMGRIETLQAIASSKHLREGELDMFADIARAAASVAPGDFVLADKTGLQLINTRTEPDSALSNGPDLEAIRYIFERNTPHVSDLLDEGGAGHNSFAIRIPVQVLGQTRYAFGYIPRTPKVLNVLRESSLSPGWYSAVVDRKGQIIARSSKHEEFVGKSASPDFLNRLIGPTGQIESVDLEGRQTVTAYRRSPLSEWSTVVWVPKIVLQERANTAAAALSALALVTLVFSLVIGYVVSRLIRRPTRQLLESAHGLKQGSIVIFEPTIMREANIVGAALADASRDVQLYMREISHRSKNLLAVVQSISRQTQRGSSDLKSFGQRFDDRLQSLARSHDLLVERNWGGILIRDLVSAQLASFRDVNDKSISLEGPPILLNPAASQHLGLAIHELATNASKYGALSVPQGRVQISWEDHRVSEGASTFRMVWQELGGPAVSKSLRKGFGRFVIEEAVARGLGGQAVIDWNEGGLKWSLEAPSSCLGGETPFRLEAQDQRLERART
jgi:two-component sensor histidine kinase